jgi:hypothetical protein
MFGLFKNDPAKKLQQQYAKLMEEAMQLQRKGDIKGYALKVEAAEKLAAEIARIKNS